MQACHLGLCKTYMQTDLHRYSSDLYAGMFHRAENNKNAQKYICLNRLHSGTLGLTTMALATGGCIARSRPSSDSVSRRHLPHRLCHRIVLLCIAVTQRSHRIGGTCRNKRSIASPAWHSVEHRIDRTDMCFYRCRVSIVSHHIDGMRPRNRIAS